MIKLKNNNLLEFIDSEIKQCNELVESMKKDSNDFVDNLIFTSIYKDGKEMLNVSLDYRKERYGGIVDLEKGKLETFFRVLKKRWITNKMF